MSSEIAYLSNSYLALFELSEFGSVKKEDILWNSDFKVNFINNKNYHYLNTTISQYDLVRYGWMELLDYIDGIEQFKRDPSGYRNPISKNLNITKAGLNLLKETVIKRKQRFNIRSSTYENAFFSILINNQAEYTEFEREMAIVHNAINKDNILTKTGEKYLSNKLHRRLQEKLFKRAWTFDTGPNMAVHSVNYLNNFSNWRKIVKYDWTLLHKVDGLGAIILSNMDPIYHDYIGLILSSESTEEACENIKLKQTQQIDIYPFCYE